MNNILYIIAGLVIILVVGVLVLRKNKAQQPSMSPRAQPNHRAGSNQEVLTPDNKVAMPTQQGVNNAVTDSTTKFDNVTIAQRFIDQQRYDKAIETLERGLKEKPADGQLLLKLLNVYALTNQNDDFYNTYHTINTHSDAATIAQAQQLKQLIDDEQANAPSASFSSTASINEDSLNLDSGLSLSTINDLNNEPQPIEAKKADNTTLDFDLPISFTPEETVSAPVVDVDVDSNHTFDLTLDDLEDSSFEEDILQSDVHATIERADVMNAKSDDLDLDSEAPSSDLLEPNVSGQTDDHATIKQVDIEDKDSDFALDFNFEAMDTVSEDSQEALLEDNKENEFDLDNDDFNLDFDGLEEEITTEQQPDIIDTTQNTVNDDFAVSLDEERNEPELDILNTMSADGATIDAPAHQDDSIDFNLEDIETEHTEIANDTIKDNSNEITIPQDNIIDLEITDGDTGLDTHNTASTPTFDDDAKFDLNDFDDVETTPTSINTITPVMPDHDVVEIDSLTIDDHHDTIVSSNINEQFATDFDFVKTLDNNQVTLDLANQYLQLGEYDSAKRLLNEVVAQGNSEQQQQAKELLTLTA